MHIDKHFIQAIYNVLTIKTTSQSYNGVQKCKSVYPDQPASYEASLSGSARFTCIYFQLDHVFFNRDFLNKKASETNLPNFFIVDRPVFFINNVNL